MRFNSLMLAVTLAIAAPLHASQDFSEAYKAYQAAVEADDGKAQLITAKQAFETGQNKFGKAHINSANLALNYARALALKQNYNARNAPQFDEAHELLDYALSTYEKEYGEQAPELIDPLLALGRAYGAKGKDAKSKAFVIRAIKLADQEPPLIRANIYSEASLIMQRTIDYRKLAKRYAFEAHDLYLEHAPENALERNLAAFQVAKYHMGERKLDKAEDLLLGVVGQFQALDYSNPIELAAHAFLVDIYESQGEREQATEHCLAIGKMTPWSDAQEPEPIFRTHPKYPMSAAMGQRDGFVEIKFNIDKMGFVTSPEVTKSGGGSAFETSALKAVKEWRYAPRFEGGVPVDSESKVRLDFRMNR